MFYGCTVHPMGADVKKKLMPSPIKTIFSNKLPNFIIVNENMIVMKGWLSFQTLALICKIKRTTQIWLRCSTQNSIEK